MLWKVLSEFPGEDQSTPPLCFGDITDLVIIRNQEYIIEGECPTAYTGLMHERV